MMPNVRRDDGMDSETLGSLSLALGLGLLIGLQRERAGSAIGGIRTFPLLALLGAICGLLAYEWGQFVVVAGFIAVTAIAVLSHLSKLKDDAEAPGQTSEAAALLTYALGAYLAAGNYAAGIVVGGIAAVLLHFKQSMHEFAGGMSERDVRAIMHLVIVSLIILPVLPDQTYGPYDVLNPRQVWLMVALIVGIGLAGYVAYKLVGARAGVMLGGVLGGLVSSTATTIAYARRVRASRKAGALAAVSIVIASTIAVARVAFEVAVVAPGIVPTVAPPLAALFVWMTVVSLAMWWFARDADGALPEQENPAQLATALIFGVIYATVIFTTAAVKEYFGAEALYVVAAVSGFVDVDAITLSSAQLAAAGRIEATTAWRLIIIASLVNLVFKAGAALVFGSRELFRRVVVGFGASIVGGVVILLAWPAG
jgi:uncharacterized membrane protein (DUF4010 family)